MLYNMGEKKKKLRKLMSANREDVAKGKNWNAWVDKIGKRRELQN